MNKKEDTAVGFILGNVPVELLTFEQELNYGTIIQAHLKKVEEANGVDFADSVYKDALAQLTNHNIKLVVKVAKDYKGYKLPLEDLIQDKLLQDILPKSAKLFVIQYMLQKL